MNVVVGAGAGVVLGTKGLLVVAPGLKTREEVVRDLAGVEVPSSISNSIDFEEEFLVFLGLKERVLFGFRELLGVSDGLWSEVVSLMSIVVMG